jgi:hypothetical protein
MRFGDKDVTSSEVFVPHISRDPRARKSDVLGQTGRMSKAPEVQCRSEEHGRLADRPKNMKLTRKIILLAAFAIGVIIAGSFCFTHTQARQLRARSS